MANGSGWSQPRAGRCRASCPQQLRRCSAEPPHPPRRRLPTPAAPGTALPSHPAKLQARFWEESSEGFILLKKNSVLGVLRKAPALGCVPVLSVQWEPGEIIPVCHSAMSLHVELKSLLLNVSAIPSCHYFLKVFRKTELVYWVRRGV